MFFWIPMLFQAKTKPRQSKGKAHAAKQKPSQCKEQGRQRPSQRQAKARPTHCGVHETRTGCSIIAMYSLSDAIDLFCLGFCRLHQSSLLVPESELRPCPKATFQCFKKKGHSLHTRISNGYSGGRTVWKRMCPMQIDVCEFVCLGVFVRKLKTRTPLVSNQNIMGPP